MTDARKVLVTGAAGIVGSILRAHWGDRYSLRLADTRPINDLAPHESFVEFDIAELDAFLAACEDIDTVIHLAADAGPQSEFYSSLLHNNIIGAYNAFEAPRQAGCSRVVFASSVNAVLGHCGRRTVDQDSPVYPMNVYGATKSWGEALGRVYSDQHGLSCICVRLTGPNLRQDGDWDPDEIAANISPRDCAQLFARCVDVADVDFALVNGISRHRRTWLDLDYTCRILGYEPQDGTAFPRG